LLPGIGRGAQIVGADFQNLPAWFINTNALGKNLAIEFPEVGIFEPLTPERRLHQSACSVEAKFPRLFSFLVGELNAAQLRSLSFWSSHRLDNSFLLGPRANELLHCHLGEINDLWFEVQIPSQPFGIDIPDFQLSEAAKLDFAPPLVGSHPNLSVRTIHWFGNESFCMNTHLELKRLCSLMNVLQRTSVGAKFGPFPLGRFVFGKAKRSQEEREQ
jgi:hypothetical protein